MSSASQTVLLIEGDGWPLASLKRLFAAGGIEVRSHASIAGLLAAGPPAAPACLLLDFHSGGISGTEVQAQLARHGWDLPIVFLIQPGELSAAVVAIRAGAYDVLIKPCAQEELLNAVSRALASSRETARQFKDLTELRRRAKSLGTREQQVVRLVVSGLLNKEIADTLNLALITVKVHRGNAMRKLGARNPAELARIARAVGFCETDCSAPPLNASNRGIRPRL